MYKEFPSHPPHSTESRRRRGVFFWKFGYQFYLYGKLFPADAC